MNERIQDKNDMALAALLNSVDRPMSPELREDARRIAGRHFAAADGVSAGLLPEGALIGHYQIERVLGVGGQAVVYLARHTRLGARQVAIKVPHGQTSRMLREADAMARLDHPGIAGIVDLDAEAEPPYLVLEYYAGGSLADRLEDGPLSEAEVLRVTRALLEALAFAHEHDVVHRDLKPENVLFDGVGNPLIADFGLGKVVAEQISLSLSQGTHTGIAGTPLYMAPEQERPGAAVDGRTDLYALGKLIYRMLTGEHPRTLRPIEHSRSDLRHPWSELVFKLTESFPDSRHADAGAVLADLATWDGGAPSVWKRTESQAVSVINATKRIVQDPSLRQKASGLVQTILSSPAMALAFVLGTIGAVGMALGAAEAFMPLVFGFVLALSASGGEKKKKEEEAATLEAARKAAVQEIKTSQIQALGKPRRSGGQTLALVFAVLGFVVTFFTAMGATVTLVVAETFPHRGSFSHQLEPAVIITFVVAGFFLLGSLILYWASRPARPQSAPPVPTFGNPATPPSPPAAPGQAIGILLPEPPQPPTPPGNDPLPRA